LSIGSLKSEPVIINCTFSDNNLTSRCDVWGDLKIHHENQEIIIENVENRENVSTFVVIEKIIPYFPQGIDKYFPTLKALQITSSGLRKISSTDLQNLVHLEFLNLDYNDIEILGENLFKFNKNLSAIYLNSNKIKEIIPTAFDGLKNIENLLLTGNICYSGNGVNKDQVMLIINILKTKCWSDSLDIKKFILGVSKMENGIEVLRKIMKYTSYEVINMTINNLQDGQLAEQKIKDQEIKSTKLSGISFILLIVFSLVTYACNFLMIIYAYRKISQENEMTEEIELNDLYAEVQ